MKTKTAYLIMDSGKLGVNFGRNLRTYAAARRVAKILRRRGVDCHLAKMLVSRDAVLRK